MQRRSGHCITTGKFLLYRRRQPSPPKRRHRPIASIRYRVEFSRPRDDVGLPRLYPPSPSSLPLFSTPVFHSSPSHSICSLSYPPSQCSIISPSHPSPYHFILPPPSSTTSSSHPIHLQVRLSTPVFHNVPSHHSIPLFHSQLLQQFLLPSLPPFAASPLAPYPHPFSFLPAQRPPLPSRCFCAGLTDRQGGSNRGPA